METASVLDSQTVSIGLLIGRLVVGLLMAAHGAQKLFGWFGGHGVEGTGKFFGSLGFEPGRLFATLAGLAQVGSGLLIALGFLGPIGPAIMLSVMIVAGISVHWRNGLFATNDGIEVPLLYATGAVALAFTGFGRYSLDAVVGPTVLKAPAVTLIALAVGIVGGVVNLVLVRKAPATSTDS
jgi:putative oxidoreductase